jgi:hypothetical protein
MSKPPCCPDSNAIPPRPQRMNARAHRRQRPRPRQWPRRRRRRRRRRPGPLATLRLGSFIQPAKTERHRSKPGSGSAGKQRTSPPTRSRTCSKGSLRTATIATAARSHSLRPGDSSTVDAAASPDTERPRKSPCHWIYSAAVIPGQGPWLSRIMTS